jgi:type IV pilus assembly protein PilA
MEFPTTRRGSDAGFSMVELLVVIIIIGVLAAIAIPLYLDHQAKASDAAAQSDAMNLGTMVRAAFDESETFVVVTGDGDSYLIDGEIVMGASPGVEFVRYTGDSISTWCVELRHPGGQKANDPGVRFDAQNGYVEQASCP